MADPAGPGPVSGVSGTPPLRRIRRSGERKTRRQRQRSGEDQTTTANQDTQSRKGRYLDERC
jgi:hypothetical protein